jgi:hypothetical protein
VSNFKSLYLSFAALLFAVSLSTVNFAQESAASLRGRIVDQQDAIVIGATVEAVDSNGQSKTVVSDSNGEFVFNNLAPGKYTIRATQEGFSKYENAEVEVKANAKDSLKITLEVSVAIETVTVADEDQVSTEPDNNGGAVVLKEADIDALPDNPDDLEAALRGLAGPGAGPNGGDFYIDGFKDGRLPPKSSIREIRINSNPYSAEYDRVGFGRIEILTKPGGNSLHGQAFFNFNDESLNARNPFAAGRASYQSRQYGGNISGSFS